MEIKLYKTPSDVNTVSKVLNNEIEFDCNLLDNCSILNPIITIKTTTNLSTYNYARIAHFSRYYYITNIETVRNDLWKLSLRVDVLKTYETQIRNTEALVVRQENLNTPYITDSEGAISSQPLLNIVEGSIPLIEESNMSYVLVTSGTGGV